MPLLYTFLFFIFILPLSVFANCPPPPVGNTADTVIQMRAHGGNAGMGPTTALDATEEGALIYDDANNTVKVCDGTNWVDIGGGSGGGGITDLCMWGNNSSSCNCNGCAGGAAGWTLMGCIDSGSTGKGRNSISGPLDNNAGSWMINTCVKS